MTQPDTTEQITKNLDRIAKALEAIAANLAGTNERLDSMREGLAILNTVIEEASNR